MSSRKRNTPENNKSSRDSQRRSSNRQKAPRHTVVGGAVPSRTEEYTERTQKNIGRKKMDRRMRLGLLRSLIFLIIGIGLAAGIFFVARIIAQRQRGFENPVQENISGDYATQVPQDRINDETSSHGEILAPDPEKVRDISFGAKDIDFKETKINIPGIFDTELVFSAGTASGYGQVLTKLYLYNLDTQTEELITKSQLGYNGEIYETYVNHNWIIWLDTDKGEKNHIKVMNRGTGQISTLRTTETGKPKLRLYGDTLVWMQQVSDAVDKLFMIDLNVQEDLILFDFTDKATYGVSAPCIYEDTIIWAGPGDTEDTSGIYSLKLETDEQGLFNEPEKYLPGTYVHEPLYNGDMYIWLSSNKSRDGKLYLGRFGEDPIVIDQDIATYSLGEGIVVYGKDSGIWVYVIATGELCRLTSPGEEGMLPSVSKRTVVWYNLTQSRELDKDVLRYKILTNEELYPGGKP